MFALFPFVKLKLSVLIPDLCAFNPLRVVAEWGYCSHWPRKRSDRALGASVPRRLGSAEEGQRRRRCRNHKTEPCAQCQCCWGVLQLAKQLQTHGARHYPGVNPESWYCVRFTLTSGAFLPTFHPQVTSRASHQGHCAHAWSRATSIAVWRCRRELCSLGGRQHQHKHPLE
jgi:hypothetical protein